MADRLNPPPPQEPTGQADDQPDGDGKAPAKKQRWWQTPGRSPLGPWLRLSPTLIPIAVLIYAGGPHASKSADFSSVFSVGLMCATAALISGALVGFLFGLPRTIERLSSQGFLATNTNLDQVSDWLTKVLVGLGLVQLGKVAGGVNSVASSIAPGLGGGQTAEAFAIGLLVYAAVDGFLLGYLWTRIVVSVRFRDAARALEEFDEALGEKIRKPSELPPPPAAAAGQ